MKKEDPEIGKIGPKKEEPIEPFLPDELFTNRDLPPIQNLHFPKLPLVKKKLKAFLIELFPIIKEIEKLRSEDVGKVASYLQKVKAELHIKEFSEEEILLFEKMFEKFSRLIVRASPEDREAVLDFIEQLDARL